MTWTIGFIQAVTLLADRKAYNRLFDELRFFDGTKKLQPKAFLETNFAPEGGANSRRNKAIYYSLLPAKHKPAYWLWNFILTGKYVLKKTPIYGALKKYT